MLGERVGALLAPTESQRRFHAALGTAPSWSSAAVTVLAVALSPGIDSLPIPVGCRFRQPPRCRAPTGDQVSGCLPIIRVYLTFRLNNEINEEGRIRALSSDERPQ